MDENQAYNNSQTYQNLQVSTRQRYIKFSPILGFPFFANIFSYIYIPSSVFYMIFQSH